MKFILIVLTILFAVSESSAELEIKFKFYATALNDSKTIKYGKDITSVVGTRFFNPEKDTLFHIHGYTFYSQSRGAKPLIDAYIKNPRDVNIVYIDYSAYTTKKTELSYELVNSLEEAMFKSLRALRNAAGGFKHCQIVAYGIGSYLAAEIGRFFIKEEGYAFDRITLLDPSGEKFRNVFGFWIDEFEPITKDCAKFVDVVHTNGGAVGERKPLGHVDFYVNDGMVQKLCMNWWKLAEFAVFDVQMFLTCSHQMSWWYYQESLLSDAPTFLAYKCPSCENGNGQVWEYFSAICTEKTAISMGILTGEIANDPSKHGCYYVPTNEQPPFSED